ncbi:MAG: hypothetical protein HN976_41655 [Lentisphaerae bacterium]|jgi:hypothetical protein|nr:hypothetical protein [Lentisphaerota bacterium]
MSEQNAPVTPPKEPPKFELAHELALVCQQLPRDAVERVLSGKSTLGEILPFSPPSTIAMLCQEITPDAIDRIIDDESIGVLDLLTVGLTLLASGLERHPSVEPLTPEQLQWTIEVIEEQLASLKATRPRAAAEAPGGEPGGAGPEPAPLLS